MKWMRAQVKENTAGDTDKALTRKSQTSNCHHVVKRGVSK
jgi:hypothetical protein